MSKYTRWLTRLIGPGILAYFLLTTDVNKVAANLRDLDWLPVLLSLAMYPGLIAVKAWRWNLLMRSLGMRAPSLGYSMILYMIGQFAGGATPGQSGDFIKAWYLRERGRPLASALFSILLDRLFDFLVMALLSLLGLIAFLHLFSRQLEAPILVTTVGFAAAMALAIPALMSRRPRDWLMTRAQRLAPRRVHDRLERWRGQFAALDMRPALMGSLLLTSLGAAMWAMARLWLLFRAMDVAIPLTVLVCSVALVSILQTLPISFSGIGVRDAVLIAVLASYGYGRDTGLALSALFLLITLEHVLIGFLVSLRHPLGRPAPAEPPARVVPGEELAS
jgi:glycosyltransferase 2 family protein